MKVSRKFNIILLSSILWMAPGHPNLSVRAQTFNSLIADVEQNLFIKDELYFGLSRPDGGVVSEAEWTMFVNCVITPRFKEGITILDSYGQYLQKNGSIAKEKSKIVIFLYQENSDKNKLIEEIIQQYKQRFRQESVLRTTSTVKASF